VIPAPDPTPHRVFRPHTSLNSSPAIDQKGNN